MFWRSPCKTAVVCSTLGAAKRGTCRLDGSRLELQYHVGIVNVYPGFPPSFPLLRVGGNDITGHQTKRKYAERGAMHAKFSLSSSFPRGGQMIVLPVLTNSTEASAKNNRKISSPGK